MKAAGAPSSFSAAKSLPTPRRASGTSFFISRSSGSERNLCVARAELSQTSVSRSMNSVVRSFTSLIFIC